MRIFRYIGRRGTFLLFWAFLWMSTGYRWMVSPPQTDNYVVLFHFLPPHVWGILFLVQALIMAVGAFWKKLDPWSYFVSASVSSFLGTAVLLSGPGAAGATVVLTYYLYALLVLVVSGWPEAKKARDP